MFCQQKDFLHKIGTGEEKWVLFDNPKIVSSSKRAIHQYSKTELWCKKTVIVHLVRLERCYVLLYYGILEPGQMVNTKRYKQQLIKASDGIEQKRPFMATRRKNFGSNLQDGLGNSCPRSVFFRPRSFRLPFVEDVEKRIDEFINSKQSSFFRSVNRQLLGRCQKCVHWETFRKSKS